MNEKFKEWLKDACVRAIKTVAQTAGGMITVGVAISDVEWAYVASVSAVAGIYSIIMSIAKLPGGDE